MLALLLLLACAGLVVSFLLTGNVFSSRVQQRSWTDSPYEFNTLAPGVFNAIDTVLSSDQLVNPNGTLTLTVHGRQSSHGRQRSGLGDRIRGVYTAAMVALLTQRTLRIEPYILLSRPDPQSVDTIAIGLTGDCTKPLFDSALSSKQHVRISTNCIFQRKYATGFLQAHSSLPTARLAAAEALMRQCDGNLLVSTNTSCAGGPSGCLHAPRSYQCGAFLLHAAFAAAEPEMAALLWDVHDLHRQWRQAMAPRGYNAVHFRTGHALLHMGKGVTLESTPWRDPDWCGERCTQWIQRGAAEARKHRPTLPIAVVSDSALLIGILQSRTWNSLRLLHCCAGAAHVAHAGALSHEQDMSILRQNLFDLAMLGNAKRLFVDKGHFWSLGMFWWSARSDTLVFREQGPASTLSLVE